MEEEPDDELVKTIQIIQSQLSQIHSVYFYILIFIYLGDCESRKVFPQGRKKTMEGKKVGRKIGTKEKEILTIQTLEKIFGFTNSHQLMFPSILMETVFVVTLTSELLLACMSRHHFISLSLIAVFVLCLNEQILFEIEPCFVLADDGRQRGLAEGCSLWNSEMH